MKLHFFLIALALSSISSGAIIAGVAHPGDDIQAAANGTFTWDKTTFQVNGKAYHIAGGQIDPQRVPRAYWAQRLQMAKAMGLNTIFSCLLAGHREVP